MTTTTSLAAEATFARGVHPPERKELVAEAAIEVFPAPEEVRIPLLQHLGAPCEPAHKPRTAVVMGEVVGQATAFVSAPVHASVSGTTVRGSMTTLPNGRHVPVIPIKAAAEQPLSGRVLYDDCYGGDWPNEKDELERFQPREIADAARQAGLVGLGGAAFPTHVKLARNDDKPIKSLLVNGCECEPYLAADYRLMLEAPRVIITGALLAARATGASEVMVCIEDNKSDAIDSLLDAAEATPVRVRVLTTKYPQGGEKQLISAAVGKEVPTGGLPLDVGVVVLNVGTAAALARAVVRGKPLTHRIISVSGRGVREPKNLLVPVGTSYGALIEYCGGMTEDAARVVAGGPMMGFTLGNLDVPVTKGTSGVTVLTHDEISKAPQTNCIRCGQCVYACPQNLVPSKLALATRAGNLELARRYHLAACIECGSCAYACPANIPLVQMIRVGKVMLRKK